MSPNGTPLRALIEAYKCQDIVTIATSNIIVASGETESAHHPLPVLLQPYPSSLALTAAGMLPQLGIVQVERLRLFNSPNPSDSEWVVSIGVTVSPRFHSGSNES